MRKTTIAAAIAATLAVPAMASAPAAPFTFHVGEVMFVLPRPAGYCEPQGPQIGIAQRIAAGDTGSATNLTLLQCDVAIVAGANDYTLIKTPNNLLATTVTRADVLASLGKEFDDPAIVTQLQSNDAQVARDVGKAVSAPVTVNGAIRPLGRDPVCAYMGGTVAMGSATTQYVQAVGTCITVVGGRVLAISRYGRKTDSADVLQLLREAKALAESIAVAR